MTDSSQKIPSQPTINPFAEQGQHRLRRTGNLFVIHFTKELFVDSGEGKIYFHQCLETYINILKEKLMKNRDDYMGLMICNTVESDEGAENILTLIKLSTCTTNMYTELMKIYNTDIEYYKNKMFDGNCAISKVLLHAVRAYDALTVTTVARTVIFITCDDNPTPNDSNERNRIRLNAKNYKNINVKLNIIGLGKNWNYDIFYKEIEMLAEKIVGRDFKRKNLANLEEDIVSKAHIMASLPLRINNDIKIKVSIQGFVIARKNLYSRAIAKDTNEPLDNYAWYSYELLDEDDDENITSDTPEDVHKMQTFGGRNIVFTSNEVRSLETLMKSGIDILGFKPMLEEHPMYQLQPVLFIGCDAKSSAGELKFFAALLSKMAKSKLMAICAFTYKLNSRTRLYMMWPSLELGGFYLYKIPFKEDVRINLKNITDKYIFNEDNNRPPIRLMGVDAMKAIVENLCVDKYPINFVNTRQQRLIKSVEAVALELPPIDQPNDNTLPDLDLMRNKLKEMDLIDIYHDEFEEVNIPQKQQSAKVQKLDDEYVKNVIRTGNFNKLTAVALKSILRTVGLSSSGNKADLIKQLCEYKEKHSL